jgi:hypothetical protein
MEINLDKHAEILIARGNIRSLMILDLIKSKANTDLDHAKIVQDWIPSTSTVTLRDVICHPFRNEYFVKNPLDWHNLWCAIDTANHIIKCEGVVS